MTASTSRIKIIIVGPAHPLRGGIAAFNERLALALQELGHEVVIYTFSFQYPGFLFPGKTQYSSDPPPQGLDIRAVVHSLNPFNWIATVRSIRNQQADLVILRYWIPFMAPCLGTIGRWIRKSSPAHVTGLVDNALPHEKRAGDSILLRYFGGACHDFMALSKSVASELTALTGKSARVSPHPVYDQYGECTDKISACRNLQIDPEQQYLLFFGLVRAYKGLDLLLEGFARSEFARKKYKLLIAGEFYEDKSKYDQIIRQHNLQESVIIHDRYIDDACVRFYFSVADMITQTYRTATQSGISQLAFHFEKPILITDVGGLSEIVEDGTTGFVCLPEAASISDALDNFAEKGLSPGSMAALKNLRHSYSWSNFCATLLQYAP
jgi:D-inositol-3-phosphate glycosyltransferase